MGSYQSNFMKSQLEIINSTIVNVENNVRMNAQQTCLSVQNLSFTVGEKADITG